MGAEPAAAEGNAMRVQPGRDHHPILDGDLGHHPDLPQRGEDIRGDERIIRQAVIEDEGDVGGRPHA
jgi:hypothetical protein